jgi:hypothetical protein
MVTQGKLTKSWHRNPLVIRHTMFFFDDMFPMITHVEPEMVCILPEWVDRVKEVIPFNVTTKQGKEIKV